MVKAVSDRVLEYIQGQDDYLIEVLRHLVEAESPSAHPSSHEPTRRAFIGPLQELGLHIREVGPLGGPRHIYARPKNRDRHAEKQGQALQHPVSCWTLRHRLAGRNAGRASL